MRASSRSKKRISRNANLSKHKEALKKQRSRRAKGGYRYTTRRKNKSQSKPRSISKRQSRSRKKSRRDVDQLITAIRALPNSSRVAKEVFEYADTDKNNSIDINEFYALLGVDS